MDRTVRAVVILTLSYLAFGAYAFGVFLQQPLVHGEALTVQAALEPFAYLACMLIGNLAIYRAVTTRDRRPDPDVVEDRLLAPAIALLIVVSFGAGLHTAGTLVEETFHSHSASNARAPSFAYDVAYWLEEYLSHYLMMIPYVLLLFVLVRVEQNREPVSLGRHEKALIGACGVVLGVVFAIGCFESAAVDLIVVPLAALLLTQLALHRRRHASAFWAFPFSAWWGIGTALMILLSLAFRVQYGWLTQPTDLGFGVAQPTLQGDPGERTRASRYDEFAAHEPVATGAIEHECSEVFCRLRAWRPSGSR